MSNVAADSQEKYQIQFIAFRTWVSDHHLAWSTRPECLLENMLQYLDAMLEAKRAAGDAEKAVAALRFKFPGPLGPRTELGTRLTKALSGYRKKIPLRSRVGLPEAIAAAISNEMILENETEAALETQLRFHGYFRPGETRKLRASHVAPPTKKGHAGNRFWSVTVAPQEELLPSKAQTFDDTVQLDYPSWLGPAVGRLAQTRRPQEPLFRTS